MPSSLQISGTLPRLFCVIYPSEPHSIIGEPLSHEHFINVISLDSMTMAEIIYELRQGIAYNPQYERITDEITKSCDLINAIHITLARSSFRILLFIFVQIVHDLVLSERTKLIFFILITSRCLFVPGFEPCFVTRPKVLGTATYKHLSVGVIKKLISSIEILSTCAAYFIVSIQHK